MHLKGHIQSLVFQGQPVDLPKYDENTTNAE